MTRTRSRAFPVPSRSLGASLCLAAGLATLGGCNRGITDADIDNITLTELRLLWLEQQERTGQPLLLMVDPRNRADFEGARLPGAVHMTLPDLALQTGVDQGVDAYRRIVVYAEGPGALSGRAMTKRLLVLGYGQTRLFGGGLVEWADAGFPVESGVPDNEPAPRPQRDVRRPVP